MTRVVDALSLLLFLGAGVASTAGVYALGEARDLQALYLLVVAAFALRAATDLLRPRGPR